MFLREVVKEWVGRWQHPARHDGATDPCGAAPTVLEELAADGEDFRDVAAVLGLDVRELVARLAAPADAVSAPVTVAATGAVAPRGGADGRPPSTWASWGVGWGRWTRARGGTRVHRDPSAPSSRPVLAAP